MSDKVPAWIEHSLPVQDRYLIEQKIAEIEKTTRGEVVVMIARRSSFTGHVPLNLFLVLLLVFSLLDVASLQMAPQTNPWILLLISLLACLGLTGFLLRFEFIHRIFVATEDRHKSAEQRAEMEFYRKGLQKTDDSTGVLLFISLLEHRAVILGDKSIAAKLPSETWSHLLNELVPEIKKGALAQGIVQTLDKVGALLSQHFPSRGPNANELSNHLLFIED